MKGASDDTRVRCGVVVCGVRNLNESANALVKYADRFRFFHHPKSQFSAKNSVIEAVMRAMHGSVSILHCG